MQENVHPRVRHRLLRAQWISVFSLLVAGCGGGEDGASRVVSSPAFMAAAPRAAASPSRPATQSTSSTERTSPSPAVAGETPVPSPNSPALMQLSALPYLSSLSAPEKAGLLMLLPSQSASDRMALIDMYPSLSQLPIQQKQVLLDKLEKIVPIKTGQPR